MRLHRLAAAFPYETAEAIVVRLHHDAFGEKFEEYRRQETSAYPATELLIGELRRELEDIGISASLLPDKEPFLSAEAVSGKWICQAEQSRIHHIRVTTRPVKHCYMILGIVHHFFPPVPGMIRDYIAIPKPDLRQYLETTVTCEGGREVMVRIGTEGMQRSREEATISIHQQMFYQAWNELGGRCYRDYHFGLFPADADDVIFVYSRNGELMFVPRGSTALDFAFHIHTDVGLRAVQARVNLQDVPVGFVLREFDQVEIICGPAPVVSRQRLLDVKTSLATAKLRKELSRTECREAILAGRKCLADRISASELAALWPEDLETRLPKVFGTASMEALELQLGQGRISPAEIDRRLSKLK
jgi:guanosine-3',5'-bis(diphosphate) 3'-pyrophosphohydrolase